MSVWFSTLPSFWRQRLPGLVLVLGLGLLVCSPPAWGAEPVQLRITGVEGTALENVQAALVLPNGLVRDGKVDLPWLRRFQGQVPKKVKAALQPFGYFQAEADSLLQRTGDGQFTLTVHIRLGTPVRLTSVMTGLEGEGRQQRALLTLVEGFPLRSGDLLRQDQYEEAKGALKSRAIDLGYLAADFTRHEIRVHLGESSAEIDLVLDTGPRFHFGQVFIHGAPDYPDRFLRRYLAFQPGDVFSHGRLGQTQLNFLDSDRFKDAIITTREDLAEELGVPIGIQLVPSARWRMRPGIGYGTDTGARLSFLYQDVNLFHHGHELKSDLLLAELKQSLVSSYILPGMRNIETYTAFRLGYDQENLDTYETRSLFAEAERVRGFGKGRQGSVFLRLLREDYIIGNEDDRSVMVLPGVRFSRRRYKDPVRPKEGYHFRLEARGGHQSLGSDTGLLQGIVSGNTLIPLPAHFSLFARVQGAVTEQNEPLQEIPVSLRFFAGGDQSVRGYAYQSLGPSDASGEVVGGKHQLVASVELERAIGANWGVAVFYDVGNAFNDFTRMDLAHGAGIGVRRYTQIGPVRLDIARQLHRADPSFRLHLSVGFGW